MAPSLSLALTQQIQPAESDVRAITHHFAGCEVQVEGHSVVALDGPVKNGEEEGWCN